VAVHQNYDATAVFFRRPAGIAQAATIIRLEKVQLALSHQIGEIFPGHNIFTLPF